MTLEEALERIKELETEIEVLKHQLGLEQLLNDNLRFELEEVRPLP
jgi:hypothetical protein